MKRTRLKSDPAKQRAWRERSKGLNKVSVKQAAKNRVHSSMRVKVGTRAGECCEECGKYAPISGHPLEIGHAHHIVFRSKGGENELENYRYLCFNCHQKIHFGSDAVDNATSRR